MKLFDVILLSVTIALFLIAIDQYRQYGFAHSYWIFMFVLGLLGYYQLRRKNRDK